MRHSPFYARLHRGLENRPLHELPIVTREELVTRVDDIATVPRREAIKVSEGAKGFLTPTTPGSEGRPAMLMWNDEEWTTTLASYARALDWACVPIRSSPRMRLALIAPQRPSQVSALLVATLAESFINVLTIDPTEPLGSMAARLEAFQPDVLVAHPTVARPLSDLALARQVGIRPRAVLTTSDVLTRETRLKILDAFAVEPHDLYATTETGGIASECALHERHLFEDLVIPEVVDRDGRPAPIGTPGARVLVSVLHSRTLPLIRYEITDRIALRAGACPCGRPYALLDRVEGRSGDQLQLPRTRRQVWAVN